MKEVDHRNELLIIQGRSCAFGEILEQQDTPTSLNATVRITAGKLTEGTTYTLILGPYNINEHGLGTTSS